ncbi:MAG: 30S ribosomal protein S25e [Desulfurococcaceae archaeon]
MSTSKPAPKKPSPKRPAKEAPKVTMSLRTTVDINSIVQKIKSDVEKGAVKYYTPYTLAQAMNVKISDAKRALREAVNQGILRLYSGGRRSLIFVPVKHAQ